MLNVDTFFIKFVDRSCAVFVLTLIFQNNFCKSFTFELVCHTYAHRAPPKTPGRTTIQRSALVKVFLFHQIRCKTQHLLKEAVRVLPAQCRKYRGFAACRESAKISVQNFPLKQWHQDPGGLEIRQTPRPGIPPDSHPHCQLLRQDLQQIEGKT